MSLGLAGLCAQVDRVGSIDDDVVTRCPDAEGTKDVRTGMRWEEPRAERRRRETRHRHVLGIVGEISSQMRWSQPSRVR